jgi:hypothetical protein
MDDASSSLFRMAGVPTLQTDFLLMVHSVFSQEVILSTKRIFPQSAAPTNAAVRLPGGPMPGPKTPKTFIPSHAAGPGYPSRGPLQASGRLPDKSAAPLLLKTGVVTVGKCGVLAMPVSVNPNRLSRGPLGPVLLQQGKPVGKSATVRPIGQTSVMMLKATLGGVRSPLASMHSGVSILQRASASVSAGVHIAAGGLGVTARGTVMLNSGKRLDASGKNQDQNWSMGKQADIQWGRNNAKADGSKHRNDAEIAVLSQLGHQMKGLGKIAEDADGKIGTLSISASIAVCSYCTKVIRAFCHDYNLTWIDDIGKQAEVARQAKEQAAKQAQEARSSASAAATVATSSATAAVTNATSSAAAVAIKATSESQSSGGT